MNGIEQHAMSKQTLSLSVQYNWIDVIFNYANITCFELNYKVYGTNLSPPMLPSLLSIVLSVFLRFMDSDYPFGIFKLFKIKRSVSLMYKITINNKHVLVLHLIT